MADACVLRLALSTTCRIWRSRSARSSGLSASQSASLRRTIGLPHFNRWMPAALLFRPSLLPHHFVQRAGGHHLFEEQPQGRLEVLSCSLRRRSGCRKVERGRIRNECPPFYEEEHRERRLNLVDRRCHRRPASYHQTPNPQPIPSFSDREDACRCSCNTSPVSRVLSFLSSQLQQGSTASPLCVQGRSRGDGAGGLPRPFFDRGERRGGQTCAIATGLCPSRSLP